VGGNVQLKGMGGQLLTYRVQISTNLNAPIWPAIGTVTTDTGGAIQFSDAATTNSGGRFYRLSR